MAVEVFARTRFLPIARGAGLVLPVLVGLSASAALSVDYLRASPVFCSEGGGCEEVKHTAFAAPWGVPTPIIGLIGFLFLAVSTLLRGRPVRAFHCAAALVGALVGARLIAAQVGLAQYCAYCISVDVAACVAAAVATWRMFGGWDLPGGRIPRAAMGVSFAVLPSIILSLGFLAKERVPALIAEEIRRAPKGKTTVVEFVDFECPFCRDEFGELAPLLEAVKERVHVVRKLVPLTRIHPHALDAARAACCADMLGKGDAMAQALFRAPVDELTSAGCERIARGLGLDPGRYAACLTDPETAERIAMDRKDFERSASKGDGLPLLWIGERKLMGAQGAEALRRALDEAMAKTGS